MNAKYDRLLEPIILPNGVKLPNRMVMAPMVIKGANEDGTVSDKVLTYYEKRSDVAGLIITGSAYVNDMGYGFERQISIAKNEAIPGLKKLAKTAKKDGNKIVVQLHHAGREAVYEQLGSVLAPSAVGFPDRDYVPEEMTEEEIEETIKDFGRATKRAIEAGLDGVEIHGANHYLLQQFFSTNYNRRNDTWGGSLEKRAAFPLAVVKEVKRVVEESGKEDFIVGYRISPEEMDDGKIGYTIDESLYLMDQVVGEKVDYIHLSLSENFDAAPVGSDKSYGQLVKEVVDGRCPVLIVSNVFTADDAWKALEHGDIVAIGRAALIEPEFTKKIREGRAEDIETSVEGRLEMLALPEKLVEWFVMEGSTLPPLPGLSRVLVK